MTDTVLAAMPAWYWAVTGALLGAVLASFAAVLVERIPTREPITGRSHCRCGRPLQPWENVPVLGWLACRGQARCCGAAIPAWYVITEAAWAASCAGGGWAAGPAGIAAVLGLWAVGTAWLVLRRRSARTHPTLE